jgi:MFS family permease
MGVTSSPNFGKATQISLGIMLLYIAFNSASNIQSKIMEEDGFDKLGFFILAVVYFFMGIGSLMSNAAINKFGTKGCLLFGGKNFLFTKFTLGIGVTLWIVSTIMVVYHAELEDQGVPEAITYTVLFVVAVVNGFTVGMLWASAN